MLMIAKDRMFEVGSLLPSRVMAEIGAPDLVSAKDIIDANNAGDPLHLPWHKASTGHRHP